MDLHYNDQKVASLPVDPLLTVGGLKRILSNWLVPQGVTNYKVRFHFNNGTELAPVVFDSNQYDTINFVAHTNLLNGSKIYITTQEIKPENKRTLTGIKDVDFKILSELGDRDLLHFCTVDKYANKLCQDEGFWRRRFYQNIGEPHKPGNITWRNYYLRVVIDIEMKGWEFFDKILRSRDDRIRGIFFNIFINPNIDTTVLSDELLNEYYYTKLGDAKISFQLNIGEEGEGKYEIREYKNLTPEILLRRIYEFYQEPITLSDFRTQRDIEKNKLTRRWTEKDVENRKVKKIDLF